MNEERLKMIHFTVILKQSKIDYEIKTNVISTHEFLTYDSISYYRL